jgi:putative flippase GtrA
MLKRILTHRETQVRFLRFLVVGGTAYLVQVATMKLFLIWLGTNLAFTLSFICSTSTHYALNRFWALPSSRRDALRQLSEYLGTAALSYAINFSLFRLCLDVFRLGRMWSTAVAVPPSTLVVFLLLNYRVFRRPGEIVEN